LLATLQRWKNEPTLIAKMSQCARQRAALYQRDNVLRQYESELQALVEPAASSVPNHHANTPARATALGEKS
jgi:hypothetical protein